MAYENSLRLRIDSSDATRARREFDAMGDEALEAARKTTRLEDSARNAGNAMRALAGFATALVGALAIREVLQYASAWQETQNRLRLVTNSSQELIGVQERLIAVSQGTFQSFSATADLYSRLARSTEDLGLSQQTLIGLTETINQAVAISGASAQSATAALFQLGQGLAAGALRGEELNSVMEQTPELARAIADGLGVGIGELRELGQEGELTAERVIAALQRSASGVRSEFDKLEPSIGQVGRTLQEAFAQEIVKDAGDELKEFADVLADPATLENIKLLGSALGDLFEAFLTKVTQATRLFNQFVGYLRQIGVIEVDLEFNLNGTPLTEDQLQGRILSQVEAIDIAVNLDEQSLRQLEQRIAQLDRKIDTDKRFAARGELNAEQLANLGSAETEFKNLLRILYEAKDAVPELFGEFKEGASEIETANDNILDFGKGIDKAAEKAAKLADQLRKARVASFTEAVIDISAQSIDNRINAAGGRIDAMRDSRVQIERDDLEPLIEEIEALSKDIIEAFQRNYQLIEEQIREGKVDADEGRKQQEELTKVARDQLAAVKDLKPEIEDLKDETKRGLADVVRNLAGLGSSFFDGARDLVGIFRDENLSVAEKIEAGFRSVGGTLQDIGASIGGPVGAVLGTVGAVADAIGAAIGFFKDLFGKPSNDAAGAQFSLDTGIISADFSKNNNPETIKFRDEIVAATTALADSLRELTGGNFGGREIVVISGTRGTEVTSGAGSAFLDPGDSEGVMNAVLDQAIGLLRGGEKSLVDFAKAARDAGMGAESILEGLANLQAVYDLTAEKMSDVKAALVSINDTVRPVIQQLEALGLSIEQVAQAAADARRQVGVSFIEGIQGDIDELQNSTLARFKSLLKAQEGIIADAQLLLDANAITEDEFRLVQFRNSLEQQRFFEGLSPEELESLGDFLGLIEDSGGRIAAVLASIQRVFSEFVDNVSETRERLKREAEALMASVERATSARDQVLRQFSPFTPTVQLGDLQGQLQNLLDTARADPLAVDANLIDEATAIFRDVVNLSAQIKGPTTGFAEDRDSALAIINELIAIGETTAAEKFSLEEAAAEQVNLLNEIREILASDDPSLPYLQDLLNAGAVQNETLANLLREYIELAQVQFSLLTPANVQAAATAAAGQTVQIAGPVEVDFGAVVVSLAEVKRELAREQQATQAILREIRDNQREATGARSATL